MRIRHRLIIGLAAALFVVAGAGQAMAQPDPDVMQTATVSEDDGFPGICDAPCFSVEKTVEVYLDGNPSAPGVCPAGTNTYVYTLTHLGPANAAFSPFTGAPISKFEIGVVFSAVVSAGFIPGTGVAPSATTVDPLDIVTWDFASPPIDVGQATDPLFICSTLLPGTATDTMVSLDGPVGLDAPGECIGPVVIPEQPALLSEIHGIEIWPRPAIFVGKATGDLRGLWKAVIRRRGPLPSEQGESVAIRGGKFHVIGRLDRRWRKVRGAITGGTITRASSTPTKGACANETFDVSAELGRVNFGAGSGRATVELVHHRKRIHGRCVTYKAKVWGQLAVFD